jgi:hypothetical protein
MNPIRAYIGSLGLAGALIALSLLLFAVVSALMSFNAWPRQEPVEPEPLVVAAPEHRPLSQAAKRERTRTRRPARRASAGVRRPTPPATHVVRVRASAEWVERRPPPPPRPRASPPPPPPPPQAPPQGSAPAARPASVTNGLGDTVEAATARLGGAVSNVSPPLGGTITDAGGAVSGLVRGLTGEQIPTQQPEAVAAR